jgi:membrane-associated HD superfamily phosphohydrolase
MRSENYKEHLKRSFDHSHRFRWGLLIAVTLIFIIALYPNLVITKHSYNIGDIAKEFLIEDSGATEANRQRAVEGVLTVYDYDSDLATSLKARVKQAFADLRSNIKETRQRQNSEKSSSENLSSSPSLPINGDILLREKIWQRKEEFENKIGIIISDGAYKILVQEEFSVEIANQITKIIYEQSDPSQGSRKRGGF